MRKYVRKSSLVTQRHFPLVAKYLCDIMKDVWKEGWRGEWRKEVVLDVKDREII